MKIQHILLCLSYLAFFYSCNTASVAVDYDRSTDFSNIKTYNYYSNLTINLEKNDSLDFVKNLDAVLESKGLTKSPTPDVRVAVNLTSSKSTKTSTFLNIGVGTGGSSFGVGSNVGIPIERKVNDYLIQIDMDNANTQNLIWTSQYRNSIRLNASPDSKKEFLKKALDAVFSSYPPKL